VTEVLTFLGIPLFVSWGCIHDAFSVLRVSSAQKLKKLFILVFSFWFVNIFSKEKSAIRFKRKEIVG